MSIENDIQKIADAISTIRKEKKFVEDVDYKFSNEIYQVLYTGLVSLMEEPPPDESGMTQLSSEERIENFTDFILKEHPDIAAAVNPPKKKRKPGRIVTQEFIDFFAEEGWTFKLNVLDDTVEWNGEPLTDVRVASLNNQLRDAGLGMLKHAGDAWVDVANRNAYHPVKERLNQLGDEWDGIDRLSEIGSFFEDTDDIFPVFCTKWLLGAVGKALDVGQNMMLVLDGAQGLGKSHFVRWLSEPFHQKYFIEGSINTDDKDSKLRLIRTFIWEVSELGATVRRSDLEQLKAFITERFVTIRRPYGRYDIYKPALANLVGTVNGSAGFLNDPSGSRRFWVVGLTNINHEYATEMDASQIWGQAVALYRKGRRANLTAEENQIRININARYEIVDPIADTILRFYDINPVAGKEALKKNNLAWFTPSDQILRKLRADGVIGNDRAIAMQISNSLAAMGITADLRKRGRGAKRGFWGVKEIEYESY